MTSINNNTDFPQTLGAYLEPSKEYFTKNKSKVYFIVKWISPKRYLLVKTYVVREDEGERYLSSTKYQHHLILPHNDECDFLYKKRPNKLSNYYTTKKVTKIDKFPYEKFE